MSPADRNFLLLDLDGVILDEEQWDLESARLAGSAFTPLLGGDPNAWALYQRKVWLEVWKQASVEYKEDRGLRRLNLARWWDRLNAQWIVELCRIVEVQAPGTFEERVDVAERALTHLYENTEAICPGSSGAIKRLSDDFEIHMASGNPAWIIETVLSRLRVRNLIGKPFGSDLLGFQKSHEQFYPAIVEAVGAKLSNVIVVDDGEVALASARKAGLKTVKVGHSEPSRFDLSVSWLAELPDVISALR